MSTDTDRDATTFAALVADAETSFAAGDMAAAGRALEDALRLAADAQARAEVLGDLAVVAMTEARHDEAARLADEALQVDAGIAAAREVVIACSELREREALAQMQPIVAQRLQQFAAMSTCVRVSGTPKCTQPVLFCGKGSIRFGEQVQLGFYASPGFLSGYGYIDARTIESTIAVGDRTIINNSVVLVAEGAGISIGAEVLFGTDVSILDSDGHDLHPRRRYTGSPSTAHVTIGDNVFLGNRVVVTKGVAIGHDTVVGAGSIVTRSLPAGVIAAGIPARVVGELDAR